MNTHFPGCLKADNTSAAITMSTSREVGREMDMESRAIINEIVNEEKMSWAIKSFYPYKFAGSDDIRPIMLQAVCEYLLSWLLKIFRGCLTTGYVPKGWREVRAAFIPKAGKIHHCSPKDYRPISLSSFLL